MLTNEFDYHLPSSFIAQTPIEPRHASKLMVLSRTNGKVLHEKFWDIGNFLSAGDLLVINQTRVIPARIFGKKVTTGGKVEILLLRKKEKNTWFCLIGGHGLTKGKLIQIINGPQAEIVAELNGSERLIQFDQPIEHFFSIVGNVPLPPYIHEHLKDPERYQTVYSREPGSAAAPTAGLHFTPELIDNLKSRGIQFAGVTLHVGLDTFAPVSEADPRNHIIHKEWCELSNNVANLINQTKLDGKRVIAVGTTSVRTIESAAVYNKTSFIAEPFCGETELFILPGYTFKLVDAFITNFHLPKSTLLMMVSAFSSKDIILNAYEIAKKENYRFFSFGDAMFIN